MSTKNRRLTTGSASTLLLLLLLYVENFTVDFLKEEKKKNKTEKEGSPNAFKWSLLRAD